MINRLPDILLGAAGSLLAVFIVYQFGIGKRIFSRLFQLPLNLARTLAEGGIRRMSLSRADYHKQRIGAGVLRDYLASNWECHIIGRNAGWRNNSG
jgi:hypothetical protein